MREVNEEKVYFNFFGEIVTGAFLSKIIIIKNKRLEFIKKTSSKKKSGENLKFKMTKERQWGGNSLARMKKNVIGAAEKTEKRRDVLEDREEKKMNVGEEMLTKNRVSMQREEEDAKGRRTRMKCWGTQ